MKVSVVVPVFNMEAYLHGCLQSLVDQTLEDMEVVVVNDGSTDGSQAIIDAFVDRFPGRVRAFAKPNGGLSDARNFGIDRCIGEYVGFVDSDDAVDPRMFAKLHAEAVRLDADVAACPVTDVFEGKLRRRYFAAGLGFGGSVASSPGILLAVGSYAWNKLYRRSLLSSRAFRFPTGQLFEDSAVVYNILLDANRVAAVNTPFYLYRRDRPGSITASPDARIFDVFRSCRNILRHFRAHPRYAEMAPYVDSLCVKHVMARYKALWRSGTPRLAFAFASTAMAFFEEELGDWKATQWFDSRRKSALDLLISRLFMRAPVLAGYLALPPALRRLARRIWRATRRAAGRLARIGDWNSASAKPVTGTSADASAKVAALSASLDALQVTHFRDDADAAPDNGPATIGVVAVAAGTIADAMAAQGLLLRGQYMVDGRVSREAYADDAGARIDVLYFATRESTLAGEAPRDHTQPSGRWIEVEHVTGRAWTPRHGA